MSNIPSSLFIVKGVSMLPVLRTGDRVQLLRADREELKEGDILVFTAKTGRKIIHRVIRLNPLQTRGDNCARDDDPVPLESELYRALSYCRNKEQIVLTCGGAGMREFKKNQRRVRFLFLIRKIFCPAAALNPFRIPFRCLTKAVFQKKTVYYAGKRPVGWMDETGWHWMRFARYFVQRPPEETDDEQ